MIHPLSKRLDMPVEHGAGAATAHRVPGSMNVEPFSGSFFAAADLMAHKRIENFSATTGDGAQTVGAQSLQRFRDRHPENPVRQMPNLDRSKSLDVKIRRECAQPLQKIQIPFFLQCGMQSAYHVHLGDSERKRSFYHSNNFVDGVFKSVRVALFGSESAELAG